MPEQTTLILAFLVEICLDRLPNNNLKFKRNYYYNFRLGNKHLSICFRLPLMKDIHKYCIRIVENINDNAS